ncbi:MAG TPA: type II toxin-antitoxin system HicB family antitoxin [Rhizomicrobium sp.]|nr:type II toxin-antitoxin system HicB family antitoxin [Rhizomicrobium sp.]
MAPRLYPAVLEKADKKTFAVWLPDFPDCVAAGTTQEQALEKLEERLVQVAQSLAERDQELPEPTPIATIQKLKDFVAFVMVKVAPPNPSERVNVYLPKNLITRADERAAELGMSRSSFFGLALNMALSSYIGRNIATALTGVTAAKPTDKRKR